MDDVTCHICHADLGLEERGKVCCRMCWYTGQFLAEAMRPVITVLEAATGTPWHAEHTGGGCFWLCTRPFGTDDDYTTPVIIATAFPDVLGGSDTPQSIREESGWLVGAYEHEHEMGYNDRDRMWPAHWQLSSTWMSTKDDYGLSDEELPMAVIEAHQWLKDEVMNEKA